MGIMIIVQSYKVVKEPKGNGRGGKNFSCCITQVHVISVT